MTLQLPGARLQMCVWNELRRTLRWKKPARNFYVQWNIDEQRYEPERGCIAVVQTGCVLSVFLMHNSAVDGRTVWLTASAIGCRVYIFCSLTDWLKNLSGTNWTSAGSRALSVDFTSVVRRLVRRFINTPRRSFVDLNGLGPVAPSILNLSSS